MPERAPLIKRVTSDELRPDEVVTLREIFDVAWGDGKERFTDEDWEHALGGVHVVLEVDGTSRRMHPSSNGSCTRTAST